MYDQDPKPQPHRTQTLQGMKSSNTLIPFFPQSKSKLKRNRQEAQAVASPSSKPGTAFWTLHGTRV